jgi:HPt (histidine-containing phosphotransfer) domain-containing protein
MTADLTCSAPSTGLAVTAAAAIDAATLEGLSQLDPGGSNRLIERVLTTYRSSLARLMGQIDEARQGSDLASVRLSAHTLKSSSASVGALQLSSLCAAAELAARDGRSGDLQPLLDQLAAEAARVDVAVRQLLDEAGPILPPQSPR